MSFDQRKKRAETSIMLRKFYRDVQQNRILSEAKKRITRTKDISRTERRAGAIRKARIKRLVRGY